MYFICRLLSESEESGAVEVNNAGCYSTVCVELDVTSLAVNTLIQVTTPSTRSKAFDLDQVLMLGTNVLNKRGSVAEATTRWQHITYVCL